MDDAADLRDWEVLSECSDHASGYEALSVYDREGASPADYGVVSDYFNIRQSESIDGHDFYFVEPLIVDEVPALGVSLAGEIGSDEEAPPFEEFEGLGSGFSSKMTHFVGSDVGYEVDSPCLKNSGGFELDFEEVNTGFGVMEPPSVEMERETEGLECLNSGIVEDFMLEECGEQDKGGNCSVLGSSDDACSDAEHFANEDSTLESQVCNVTAEEDGAAEVVGLDDVGKANKVAFGSESALEPKANCFANPVAESGKDLALWRKLPLDLLKYCVFKVRPVWSISALVAFVGLVLLSRRIYPKKHKSKGISLNLVVDEKVTGVATHTARLSNALSAMKHLPAISPFSGTGATAWSLIPLQ